jgi:hypothetical protein
MTIKIGFNQIRGAIVNVQDFGADPTGVTDSTAAIQAALDSVASDVTVTLGGGNFKCLTGLTIKGGHKILDGAGGTLTFVNAAATYAITIKTITATAAGQEYGNGIRNVSLYCSGLTSGGTNNIAIYLQQKVIGAVIDNVYISGVDGYGIYVDGALDASSFFMSPDKGFITNVVMNTVTTGLYFVAPTQSTLMSGWTLSGVYVATCTIGLYIKGCAEFNGVGISVESYTSHGVRIDDSGWGGGHVLLGGLVEGGVQPGALYENANTANRNIVVFKGSNGATPANLLNFPAMYLGAASGISLWDQQAAFFQNGAVPTLLTVQTKGAKVHIFAASTGGTKNGYAEYWLGSDVAGTATIPILIFQREAGVFSTTKGNAATVNVYFASSTGTEYTASPIGYYVQNLATASGVTADTLSVQLVKGYG